MSLSEELIAKIKALMPYALPLDRDRARRKIHNLAQMPPEAFSDSGNRESLLRLEKRLSASKQEKIRRKNNRPRPIYPVSLPIHEKKDEIVHAIRKYPVVIVSGETGSGKTTQIPKFCLEAGRGVNGKIGCTQPRRIAALTVSQRIADELGQELGEGVGFKIRFTDKTRKNTYIKLMTDGILLAETRNDPLLYEYDTLIVDEAHERSLNIDFILGFLKTLIKRRKDLKLIITSATIDTEKFSRAFGGAPVIEVSGRVYPVEVRHRKPETEMDEEEESSYVEQAVGVVDDLERSHSRGDILIFMPTEQDIMETREILEGRKYPHVTVMPIFARLSAKEQSRVFSAVPGRKIIIATNIAETSITIPGIKYVIDTGLARIPRYSPRTRTTSMPVSPVSRSSADQRKGRCGRVADGVCIRLYGEEDYFARPLYTPPEILRANLAEVILRMVSLNLGDVSDFPFIDAPSPKSIADGYDLLMEIGAIVPRNPDRHERLKGRFVLTEKGRFMSRLPVDPRISCMLIEALDQGCRKEILVIASALSIMDPRERPLEKAQAADEKHKAFFDPLSDFVTLLNIWNRYHEPDGGLKSNSSAKRFCRENFLSHRRMREWKDIHDQLGDILDEAKLPERRKPPDTTGDPKSGFHPLYAAIHKSILSGFLSNIAVKKETNIYKAPKGREVMIFPGSSLFGKSTPWIVAGEIVETRRVYARCVGAIDDKWLEEIGKDLCKSVWTDPCWDRRRGETTASEQVSLFGLIVVSGRRVSYGRINPREATDIFIRQALVEGDIDGTFPFLEHNRRLIDKVRDLENKLRRRDILIDPEDLAAFYQKRLGFCYDIRTLKHLLKKNREDSFLRMRQEDLFQYSPDEKDLARYPDHVKLDGRDFKCKYRFDPGKEDDGLTVEIPLTLAPKIPGEELDWLVPGLHREKIMTLIKGLPKSIRKQLVPISDTVDVIVAEMPKKRASLLSMLGEFIHHRFGVVVPAAAWTPQILPDHLKMRISITGNKGMEIRSGRDKSVLTQTEKDHSEIRGLSPIRKKWERSGIVNWDFPDLPEALRFEVKDGTRWILYPGLEPESQGGNKSPHTVNLRLFVDYRKALSRHKEGVALLYVNHFQKDLKFLRKTLSLPDHLNEAVKPFGGKVYVEEELYQRLIHDLFHEDIRSEQAFMRHADRMGPRILQKAQELLNAAMPLIQARYEAAGFLARLKKENRFNPMILELIGELEKQVLHLAPNNFISLYDPSRFRDMERYLKAVVIRAQRAMVSPDKDQVKAKDTRVFTDKLNEFLTSLSPDASGEKREAVLDLFWLIEEYKVSVFAQELKTPVKISDKKLRTKISEIERMV